MSDDQDRQVVRDCLSGDTESFGTLVDKYQTPLFNAALKIVRNCDDAEEITQSVFVKAFEKLRTYNPRYRFFSWIYRMIVNESLNFINQKKRHDELNPAIACKGKSPLESYQEGELSDRLQDAIMKLQVDYRVVILLRHFGEFSYKEMGYVLEIPEKTVKSRLFTARTLLRDILILRGVSTDDW